MSDRYEYITDYIETNFLFTAGCGSYVTPHIHREFELGYVVSNSMRMRVKDDIFNVPEGTLWLVNPFESHEPNCVCAYSPNDFVQLKLPFSFFKGFLPDTYGIAFSEHQLSPRNIGRENADFVRERLLRAALTYFKREPFYQLRCASDILLVFSRLLECVPHTVSDGSRLQSMDARNRRMQRISREIEENYDAKLLLSDIAEKENLSMQYLSRFFRENWGMTFQEYLTVFRCAKAREYLLTTNLSVADISLVCGFSDPKYLRGALKKHYGMGASEMRRSNRGGIADRFAEPRESKERIYNPKEAVQLLEKLL